MAILSPVLVVEKQTFADESFKIADPRGLVVLGQLANWAELRWYGELLKKCGHELKWAKVRSRWLDLSLELRRAVLRDLRDALITIIDPSLYRFDLEKSVAEAVRHPVARWPPQFRAWFESHAAKYEMRSILYDSPALRIQDFLEDDGELLGDFGGIEGDTDESRSILSDLEDALENPHSVRLFGARSAAAFSQLIDRDELERTLAELHDVRYLTPRRIYAHVLAAGERTQHVFDEGNQPSVLAITDLKDAVRKRLNTSGHIVIPEGTPDGAVEQPSAQTPTLQVADLAGGYARNLYIEFGLRVVCEEFRAVIFNGSMVRDWSRIERPDATELRRK